MTVQTWKSTAFVLMEGVVQPFLVPIARRAEPPTASKVRARHAQSSGLASFPASPHLVAGAAGSETDSLRTQCSSSPHRARVSHLECQHTPRAKAGLCARGARLWSHWGCISRTRSEASHALVRPLTEAKIQTLHVERAVGSQRQKSVEMADYSPGQVLTGARRVAAQMVVLREGMMGEDMCPRGTQTL